VKSKNETWGSEEEAGTNSYSFTYSTRNNLLSATELNRGPTSYQYDKNENITVITDPEGRTVSFTYNPRNLIASFKRGDDPEAPAYSFGYDGNKNLYKITDAREKTTQLSYDGYDRQRGVIDPLGNETLISREEFGNLATIRHLDSVQRLIRETVTVNDPLGRVAARIEKLLDNEGKAIDEIAYQYKYTEGGRVTTIIDPLGRESKIIKNDLGWVIKEIDAAGNEIEYHYEDGRGNMTRKVEKEKRADGEFDEYVTEYKYNSFNKVEKVKDPLGNTWTFTYDKRGNLAGSLDPEGNKITHAYDEFGRRTKTEKHFLNGEKVVTEFTYDKANNIKSIKDANGNTTSYTYDELNRLARVTYPDETFIEYTYDFNSNIITEKQRNGTLVINTYDDLNRLEARNITRASGVTGTTQETYEYDALSRLIKVADDDSTVEFKYDSLNRLIEEVQNGKAIRYSFDKVNNRTSLQYPNQRTIDREFDLLNRISRIKQGDNTISDFSFIGRGFRILNKTYGNGDGINELYDIGRRLTGREAKNRNAEIINQYVYGYNNAGMKTFEQRGHAAGKGDLFNYDELYRLNQVRMNSPEPQNPSTSQFEKSKSYTFDKVDNILRIVETQASQTREILTRVNNLNQYAQFDALSLAYDGNGNLSQKGNQHFTYDYRNRLVSVENGTKTTSFKYDVLGRRIEKTSTSGPAIRYYYDGYQVIEERDSSDQPQKQYVYGNGIDELLRMDKFSGGTAKSYYVHTNAIGSVTAITDNEGNLVERVSYDDYGKPTFTYYLTDPQNPAIRDSSIIGNNCLFQGREYDPETGLYFYRARYFDPQIARFLQTDPIGYRDSMNLYQAFKQNPTNFVDPIGLLKYSWNYLGIFAEDPNRNPEWQNISAFPYGDIQRFLGVDNYGIQISQSVTLIGLPYNDIRLNIIHENNKYYPRFNFFMTTMIFLNREYSDPIHVRHEKAHMLGKQLLFLETLFELKKAESISYNTLKECKSAADQLIEELHPLRRWSHGNIPDWWPKERRLSWINDWTFGLISDRFREHYKIWNKFAKSINAAQVAYDIWNFDNTYKRIQDFSISNYKLGSRQPDFEPSLNFSSINNSQSR
jgi:RHS repeat-associated protein